MTCVTPTTLEVSSSSIRGQLARWPTGVAVITALGAGRPIGKTVNSFHTTSLTPPLVGWCLDHASSQYDEWMTADGYVVHIVSADHTDLMTTFATSSADRFAGTSWTPGLDDMPVLDEPVPVRLECRITHRLPAGDHTYLVAEVIAMTVTDAAPMCLQR